MTPLILASLTALLATADSSSAASPNSEVPLARVDRVSISSTGAEGDADSNEAAISATGRYVVFTSAASTLVPNDTNVSRDVFVHDRVSGETRRVSIASNGGQARRSDGSYEPSISADGRFVAFTSAAPNLVPGDTNRSHDVFVRDRLRRVTRRVSLGPDGTQARYGGGEPAISADGRFIAFSSVADNLVPHDTNRDYDVFVRDRLRHVTRRISLGPGGVQAEHTSFGHGSQSPSISANGRYVAFMSFATNLVPGPADRMPDFDVFIRDRLRHVTRRVSGHGAEPAISADGRYVAYSSDSWRLVPGDTNLTTDVFTWNRLSKVTRRVSLGQGGTQGDFFSVEPHLSAQGRYVVFTSAASNLIAGETARTAEVYLRDRRKHSTTRLSYRRDGAQSIQPSQTPVVSAHGRYIAFQSYSPKIVPRDTNRAGDVFLLDRAAPQP